MTFIALYVIAALADVYTTHRALKASPTARETHPIVTRLFDDRPELWQLTLWAAIEVAAFVAVCYYLIGAYWPLLALTGAHLYHALQNRRIG